MDRILVHHNKLLSQLRELTNNMVHRVEHPAQVVLVDQEEVVDQAVAVVQVDLVVQVDQAAAVVQVVEEDQVDLVDKVVQMDIKDLRVMLDQDLLEEDGIIRQVH